MESVDLSESIYPVKPSSIDSLYKGDRVSLTIDNNILPTYHSPKKIELKVYANMTILELKQKIANTLTRITWRNVSLMRPGRKPDIKDKHNSRTLRDMRVRLGEKLQSEVKPILQKQKVALVHDDKLTIYADNAIREVFRRFAPEGKMGPKEGALFGAVVLEAKFITPDDSRIKELIEKWDKDKDGALSEEEFYEFYKTSSFQKPLIVMQNMKSLGYGDDLQLLTSEEDWEENDLARFHILSNKELTNGLFKLVDRSDDLGKTAWEFFSRLPPFRVGG